MLLKINKSAENGLEQPRVGFAKSRKKIDDVPLWNA